MPAPCPALLRRQGFAGPAAARRKGVPPGRVSVSAAAHRHRPQFPRGHRLSRSPRRRARRALDRALGRGFDRQGPRRSRQSGRKPQPPSIGDLARCDRRVRLRCLHRRRAPRRGKGSRQGARVLVSRCLRPMGSEEPASRALEPVQRTRRARRARARFPDQQLDRARRLAIHRSRAPRSAVALSGASARASFVAAARWCR